MDVAGFKNQLVTILLGARLGTNVGVYRGRPPVGKGPAVSVDEAEYEWEPEARGPRGYAYRGTISQTFRIYTASHFSSASFAEESAYGLASRVIEVVHDLDFDDLLSFRVSSLEEEQTWQDEFQGVVLRLTMEGITYGPSLLGSSATIMTSP